MFELIQVTAQYSNAVLVAVLPYVSDFAKKVELPVPQPITMSQVREFKCSPRSDLLGGRVILTNGCDFSFLHGHVEMYRSPQCYYELQDPDLVPKFFGPIKLSEKDAVQVARNAIKKLGYNEAELGADRKPHITPPARVGKNYVARYRVWWDDLSRGNPDNPPMSAQFEVDATTGQIQMMYLLHHATWRPDLKVDVHPPVIGKAAETKYQGGRKMLPVSQAYSNAFLSAILPECSTYIKATGFPVHTPITTNDVDMPRYICSVVDGDPMAFVDLKTHARFVYRHGQVIAFYAPDVSYLPGEEDKKPVQQFFGPVNITSNQAIALVRQTVNRLGYSEKALHVDEPPFVVEPQKYGTNTIARYFLNWKELGKGDFRVVAEVDASQKTLKSLYINDHAITSIWRKPPKVGVPMGTETSAAPSVPEK